MQVFGRRYDTGQAVCLDIVGERISCTRPFVPGRLGVEGLPWIAPGLLDVQVNGYGGQEFSSADLTAEKVERIVRQMGAVGTTRLCPTVTTQHPDVMRHALQTLDAACESSPELARRIVGLHVEGPYITHEDGPRGAHPVQYCRPPDWDEFQRIQEDAGGRIRIFTMSVEFDRSPAFVKKVVDSGVIVSIGHTAANSDQIRGAVDAGARMSTHLGNGSHPMIRRHPNYIWDQLAEDRLTAGIIADGHHLTPDVVKTFVRAKTPQRCILVSDLSGQAGQPSGRYTSDFCDIEILPGGRLVVAGQTELMAGASEPLGTCVANVMHFAEVDLETAVRMAVHHPAELLGLEPGGLEPGDPADLILFDLVEPSDGNCWPRLNVCSTLIDGETVSGLLPQPC